MPRTSQTQVSIAYMPTNRSPSLSTPFFGQFSHTRPCIATSRRDSGHEVRTVPHAFRSDFTPGARLPNDGASAKIAGHFLIQEQKEPRSVPSSNSLPAMHGLFDSLTIRDVTLRQPHRGFADVPVFLRRRIRERLAPGAPGQPRGGRRGAGVRRSHRGGSAGAASAREDLGIWSDAHIEPLARIVTRFIHSQGAWPGFNWRTPGARPAWRARGTATGKLDGSEGGWRDVVAPSAIPFSRRIPDAHRADDEGIAGVVRAFGEAARRARRPGIASIEIHAAHGYLLHEFLSPLSNQRTDRYGGSFENRTRIVREVVEAVRAEVAGTVAAVSCGFRRRTGPRAAGTCEQSVELARAARAAGRGPGGLLLGRQRARREDSHRPRLPDEACRASPARARNPHRRSRHDHRRRASGADSAQRTGRRGFPGAPNAARSLLAAACRSGIGVNVSWPAQYLRAAPNGTPERKAAVAPRAS